MDGIMRGGARGCHGIVYGLCIYGEGLENVME